jgi:hypothetical protein
MKDIQAMTAEKQVEAVNKKLVELNPGFNGKLTGAEGQDAPRIENGVVTELKFITNNVKDISPVRALVGLKILICIGGPDSIGKLSDLSPLEGMQLIRLGCGRSLVSDLSPLEGMPLTILNCGVTNVSNLSPLRGMELTDLGCHTAPVADLSPLEGMPLVTLACGKTRVAELLPLQKSLKG